MYDKIHYKKKKKKEIKVKELKASSEEMDGTTHEKW